MISCNKNGVFKPNQLYQSADKRRVYIYIEREKRELIVFLLILVNIASAQSCHKCWLQMKKPITQYLHSRVLPLPPRRLRPRQTASQHPATLTSETRPLAPNVRHNGLDVSGEPPLACVSTPCVEVVALVWTHGLLVKGGRVCWSEWGREEKKTVIAEWPAAECKISESGKTRSHLLTCFV